jgi:hypothetical protein
MVTSITNDIDLQNEIIVLEPIPTTLPDPPDTSSIVDETVVKKATQKLKIINTTQLSYETYLKENPVLNKYKLPELKSIAKQHHIPVSGTKPILIERIHHFFAKTTKAIILQRVLRGYWVRLCLRTRGPAFRKTGRCVNETDGYTLEPLVEIPFQRFISFQDNKNFIYGFDVFSLITVYKRKGNIINPYTRERVDTDTLNRILLTGRLVKLLFPEYIDSDETIPQTVSHNNNHNTNNIRAVLEHNREPIIQNIFLNSRISMMDQRIIIQRLSEIRNKTVERRIQDLFIEIDLLGNYTQSSWFSNLDLSGYIRFHRWLHEVWNFRAQMTDETKRNICPLYDPFVFNRNTIRYPDMNDSQKICLTIMENIVYGSLDIEHRKLGALHILSALTIVSPAARGSMYWLYESLVS